jgi:hypothetical protein
MQAAVLAHGIAEGQPFLDGNKRVALIISLSAGATPASIAGEPSDERLMRTARIPRSRRGTSRMPRANSRSDGRHKQN